jgi:hypothetical protein
MAAVSALICGWKFFAVFPAAVNLFLIPLLLVNAKGSVTPRRSKNDGPNISFSGSNALPSSIPILSIVPDALGIISFG